LITDYAEGEAYSPGVADGDADLNASYYPVPGPQGPPGTAAGFGFASASVDSGTGTPSVTVTTSGPDTAKEFTFTFSNLKGAKGDPGEAATDHRQLLHRDASEQHPITAITNLETRLLTIESKLLPDVTEEDNGKSLKVVNAQWEVETIYTLVGNEAGGNTLTL